VCFFDSGALQTALFEALATVHATAGPVKRVGVIWQSGYDTRRRKRQSKFLLVYMACADA
jgi:hypothetical protein